MSDNTPAKSEFGEHNVSRLCILLLKLKVLPAINGISGNGGWTSAYWGIRYSFVDYANRYDSRLITTIPREI